MPSLLGPASAAQPSSVIFASETLCRTSTLCQHPDSCPVNPRPPQTLQVSLQSLCFTVSRHSSWGALPQSHLPLPSQHSPLPPALAPATTLTNPQAALHGALGPAVHRPPGPSPSTLSGPLSGLSRKQCKRQASCLGRSGRRSSEARSVAGTDTKPWSRAVVVPNFGVTEPPRAWTRGTGSSPLRVLVGVAGREA